jgi:hypothetical protein
MESNGEVVQGIVIALQILCLEFVCIHKMLLVLYFFTGIYFDIYTCGG